MIKLQKLVPVAAALVTGMAASTAQAQNPNYAPGDLVMGFQLRSGVGSTQTVLARLPDTATFFRDGTGVHLNIANIGSLLDSTFGIGAGNSLQWYENPDLYFGLVGTWSNSIPATLQNGDPERTVYVSRQRNAVGTEFTSNSTAFSIPSSSNYINSTNGIAGLQNTLETGSLTSTLVRATAQPNTWEEFNTFSGLSQLPAFGAFSGGIQQRFNTGSFGTFSSGVGAVEGALDLYRFQAVNNIGGQNGFGETPLRSGRFEGTVTINSAGQISAMFSPVPEPSLAILVGGGMLGVLARRRRPATAALA